MNDCIFCRIVQGTVPSAKIYEDDAVLAFMDIGPIIKGHALVIPKVHYATLTEVPHVLAARLIAVVQRVAAAQQTALQADGVNIHQSNGACAGQVVPHVHFHVIPRFTNDGHRWNWAATKYEAPAEMAALAQRLRAQLAP